MPARRALVALAAATLAIGAGGCGSPVGGKSEKDKVKDVVNDFVAAGNDRDFDRVCELLTFQRRALQGGKDCVKNFQQAAKQVGKRKVTTEIEILDVRISGAQAAVDARLKSGGKPSSDQQLLLQKQKGDWLIATAQ